MKCASCGKDATQRCTRCKNVAYCDAICQKADWKEHKKTCRSPDGSLGFEDVSIKISHDHDDRGEYGAFTSISVDILVRNEKVGSISGVLVNRQIIPDGMFLSAMDGHSHEMQMVASAVFEPSMGRTKLISLRDGGDVYDKDILYIESIHVHDQYKVNGNSDLGAYAIRKLLRCDMIKGKRGIWWGVSVCIYILDPPEAMAKEVKKEYEANSEKIGWSMYREEEESLETKLERDAIKERRQKMSKYYARIDANQFLRNGFYQDPAVAKDVDSFIIIVAEKQWKSPLRSHSQATKVKFFTPEEVKSPVGKDAEILTLTKRMCREDMEDVAGQKRASLYRIDVSCLLSGGGSLARSHALHAACAINDVFIAKCILEMDASTLESRDILNVTPLMMAASVMAGKANNQGFPRHHPIIDTLLEAGASTDAMDSDGLTAYGTFKSYHKRSQRNIQAMMGEAVSERRVPGIDTLERKLMPSGGPTAADQSCGEGVDQGYIHYDEEDPGYDY